LIIYNNLKEGKNMAHKNNPFKNNDLEDQINNETVSEETENSTDEAKTNEYEELQKKYDILNQQYLRLAADFDNFRKRQEQEREDLLKFGAENALKKMIEVLDNFERGKKALENIEDCEKVKESFDLVHKQTIEALKKLGLEEIEAEGKDFDPNFHDAVMQTPSSDHPEHTVINELQKGYKMGDKVLRPTLVNVATAQE
jgi:molecular chaperone GrpE